MHYAHERSFREGVPAGPLATVANVSRSELEAAFARCRTSLQRAERALAHREDSQAALRAADDERMEAAIQAEASMGAHGAPDPALFTAWRAALDRCAAAEQTFAEADAEWIAAEEERVAANELTVAMLQTVSTDDPEVIALAAETSEDRQRVERIKQRRQPTPATASAGPRRLAARPARTRTRARGAGRPRGRPRTRGSAASSDDSSGSSEGDGPAPPPSHRLHPRRQRRHARRRRLRRHRGDAV